MTTPASPAWLRIYRYFTEQPPAIGIVTPHEVLCQIAGLSWDSARHRSAYYHAVSKACIELENENSKTLLTERGEGYRLVAGNAHLEKAISGALSTRRKLVRVAGTVSTVDVSGMTTAEVERVRYTQRTVIQQMDSMNQAYYRPPAWAKIREESEAQQSGE
jgi:hypothetical protein